MKPKLNPNVYLKAAEIQGRPDYNWGMCAAIDEACFKLYDSGKYKDLLSSYFKENEAGYWYSYADFPGGCYYDPEFVTDTEKGKLGRQLALLFMYEITKGELKIMKDETRCKKVHNERGIR